jgi:hypothetical protein
MHFWNAAKPVSGLGMSFIASPQPLQILVGNTTTTYLALGYFRESRFEELPGLHVLGWLVAAKFGATNMAIAALSIVWGLGSALLLNRGIQ